VGPVPLCPRAGIWYNARGSAAGSIVAYTLDITLVDPIEHGLIFERFLNPGRISMPDIDLDFRDDRRAEMLEYTARKYGDDKVAQIITFGTLGARAAIRDVGRVMDIPLSEVDRVAKLIPNIPGKPVTILRRWKKCPSSSSSTSRSILKRADRYRQPDGRRGAQRRHPCSRGDHHRQADHRVHPPAPPHRQLGGRQPDQNRHPVRNVGGGCLGCSRWISWAWRP
jgi:hypothetical protein